MIGSSRIAGVNPFVGPRPLETGERIFGRPREIEELYYLLSAERIVLLHSPSGAGKSSLIRAGLIPRLEQRFDVRGPTRVNTQPPEGAGVNRYVRSANLGFEQGLPEERRRADDLVSRMTLAEYVEGRPRRRSAPQNVVLIFDQFEEILTADPLAFDAKHEFFRQLGDVLQDPRIWALFALREDYLAPLDPYADRIPTHLKNRFRVDLLSRAAAQDAMSGTATEGGRTFAQDAVEKVVMDLATMQVQQADGSFESQVGPHVEPLHLQVACRGLWERMPADDLSIDMEDIESFGDVTRALATYYEDVVGAMPGVQRAIREWVGEKLITKDGIRSQVLRGAGTSEGLSNALIAGLVDSHLVRAEQRSGAVWYELVHDRLIEPVRRNNKEWFDAHLSKVQKVAAVWDTQGRPPGLLVVGEELAEAQRWASTQTSFTEGEEGFLAASAEKQATLDKERRQARHLRWLAGGATLVSAFALGAAGFGLYQWNMAQKKQLEAQESTRIARIAAFDAAVQQSAAETSHVEADRQKGVAEYNAAKADEQRQIADQRRRDAEEQSQRAEISEKRNRQTLYVADVDLADRAFAEGHFSRGNELLNIYLPGKLSKKADELRSFPWYYHWRENHQELATLTRHASTVNWVALSKDRLASGSNDKTVKLWNFEKRQEPPIVLPEGGDSITGNFSPDGKTLATGSSDGTVSLWSVATGEKLKTLKGHSEQVQWVEFSPDGKTLASASFDKTVRLWDTVSEKSFKLEGHTDVVNWASFSHDGRTVASASMDRTVRLWDVKTRSSKLDRPLLEINEPVVAVVFLGDSKELATGSTDGTVKLWDAVTGKSKTLLEKSGYVVNWLDFSRTNKTLAVASWDGSVKLLDVVTGSKLPILKGHAGAVVAAIFAPEGKQLVTGSEDGTVKLWNTVTPPQQNTLECHGEMSLAFSPDSKTLASASLDGTVILCDVASRNPLGPPLKDHRGAVNSVAFSPDSKTLASASADGTVILWNAASRNPLGPPLKDHRGAVNSVAFSPDSKTLASASADGTVILWDVASRKPRGEPLRGHRGAVNSVAFSPDCKTLATGGEDGKVNLWNVLTHGSHALEAHKSGVTSVAFSPPDGKTLVSGGRDKTVKIWNTDTRKVNRSLTGHSDEVLSVAISIDGKTVASAGLDGIVKLWDVQTQREIATLKGPKDPMRSIAFSPNGRILASASDNGTLSLWIAATEEQVARQR
jgi:WD40 repeat protein